MVRIITISSGKGGVGKTTVAANLGAALHLLNKSVAVIDCNLTTSHLGLSIGLHNPGKTLNHFLRKEATLDDVIYTHHSGLRFIPASLELSDLNNIETEHMKGELKSIFDYYDFLILDSAPGIGREALIALRACDEVIFVTNPYVPSIVDVMKTKTLARQLGFRSKGVVVNRVRNKKYELKKSEIMQSLELPVLVSIPEDEAILKCSNARLIPVLTYPRAKASRAFIELAHVVAGLPCRRRF
jgi:septum site-determining protein MinD